MTDVLERPKSALAHTARVEPATFVDVLDWVHTDVVEPAVWIGRYKGAYVGMIEERTTEGFISLTRLGRNLGRYDTLDDAKAAFVVH